MGLIREAGRHDFTALRAICDRALDHDRFTEQELLDVLWRPPDGDLCHGLVAELSGKPVGMVFATEPADWDEGPPSAFIQMLAVNPDAWGLGIGKALVTEMEALVADRGIKQLHAAGVGPRYLWAGIDVRYTAAVCLFERLGYERYYDAINMDVVLAKAPLDTAADEERLRGLGIRVRRLSHDDRESFGAWMGEWERGWAEEALCTLRRDPVSCHVALNDDGFLGFAAYDGNRRGWFGPMGTNEAARGTGIGTVLLRRCMRDMRDRGDELAEISWTGPVHFYGRGVGARVNRILGQFSKTFDA